MRLKELRESYYITQRLLGMHLGISQNTLSRYETGKREPSIKELIAIADYFHVTLDYLLERTNNPH